MTLTERYLKAVAAQLPKAGRDDIIEELREAIRARMEDREEELGRSLVEADEETVLREFGHPLSVAARYGSGPLHVVGPELFPWWMFGVKVALLMLAAITLVGIVVRVIVGDVQFGQAIGQGFADVFSGAITIVGFATIAGFILERQKIRPAFMTEWRVRDLGLFELGGLDPDTVSRKTAESGGERRTARIRPGRMSPTARALGSAIAWAVFLLWWTGVLGGVNFRAQEVIGLTDGAGFAAAFDQTLAMIYWPVVAFAVGRILFDLARAARPGQVRFTALGDIVCSAAWLAFFAWTWTASPLAPFIAQPDVAGVIHKLGQMFAQGQWSLSGMVMLIVIVGSLQTVGEMLWAAWRLVSGEPKGQDKAWLEADPA